MQIKNLMTENLITIDKDQNLSDALKLFRKYGVSRLPVTNTNNDNQKELVGIVSERDIVNKLGSSKHDNLSVARFHISSVMVKDVIVVPETMELNKVANIMLDNGIGSVPVESEEEQLIGIVSKADFTDLATGKLYSKIPVKDVMSTDIVSISPNERLIHARRIMGDNKVGRLPVIEDDELIGMVTSKDLMRAYIEFRKKTPEKYQKAQIKEIFVDDIMSSNPTYVSPEDSISEVANIMVDTGFNGLPVVENNQVIGMITQTDILRKIKELEES